MLGGLGRAMRGKLIIGDPYHVDSMYKETLDELKIKEIIHIDKQSLFSWHANLITVNRRKTCVLVNDNNRYVIVLYELKAKDFKKKGGN